MLNAQHARITGFGAPTSSRWGHLVRRAAAAWRSDGILTGGLLLLWGMAGLLIQLTFQVSGPIG
jgi:hypothetical protein